MDQYSFTDPLRDGWLSWPCWQTDSGRLNCKVVTHPGSSLAQDRESSPVETSVLTTMLRHHVTSIQHLAPSRSVCFTTIYLSVSRTVQEVVDEFWWNLVEGLWCMTSKNWLVRVMVTAALTEACTVQVLILNVFLSITTEVKNIHQVLTFSSSCEHNAV